MNYIYINYSLIRFFRRHSKLNLQSSAKKYLSWLNIAVQVEGKIPRTGPTLVLSDHQTTMDLFYMYAEIDRDDAHFFGSVINNMLGKKWMERLIPVHLSNYPVRHSIGKFRQWLWTKREGYISREEAVSRNRKSVTLAAKLLQQGKLVLLFPTGQKLYHEHHLWSKGVAHLLKEANFPQIQLVFVHIERISLIDQIRQFVPHWLLRFAPKCTVHIQCSQVMYVNKKTLSLLSPAELTSYLKEAYDRSFHSRD